MTFARLTQELKIRRCSPKTLKAYLHYNQKFLLFCKKDTSQITTQDIRNYLEYLIDQKLSGNTIRLAYNSLLFYYHQVLCKQLMRNIKIPKKDHQMTIGLTKTEVNQLLAAIKNPKHRLLIELIYGSGLRASEAVKIKFKDIFIKEKMLIIKSGKGRKDRRTILSQKFISDFKTHLNKDNYLFPGRKNHLTLRSVQQIIKQAATRAKIKKRVYPHLLRHAFATHLLQDNVDTYYIQKLLGHQSQKTTENYIQVNNVSNIKSPLD